jgi:hypothetical protein
MAYILRINCGRIGVEGMFCSLLFPTIWSKFKAGFNDEVYLGDLEREASLFPCP